MEGGAQQQQPREESHWWGESNSRLVAIDNEIVKNFANIRNKTRFTNSS